jgi:iron complex outermembrane receptor protein
MSSKRSAGAKRSLTFLNTLLLASAVSVPAFAQIETVVVTAEKRAQDVQTVPVAISVFNSEKRDAMGIQSIQDMTNFTPGLQYSTSTDRISLRGVGRMTNVLSADASVANYDDGLYETFAVAAGRSSMDLDRVEVLRGPQGTLYGRNAIAGALNEVTKHPDTDAFHGEFRATYGNYDHATLEASLSGPLSDVWAYRIYGVWDQQTEGYAKNVIPGHPDEGNVINEWYVDAQIQAKWNSHFEMWTKFQTAQWYNGAGGPGAASGGWHPNDAPTYEFGTAATALNPGYGCTAQAGGPYATANTTAYAATSPLPAATACLNPSVETPWRINRLIPYKVRLPEYVSINSQWTYHTDADFDIKYIVGGTFYHYHLTGPSNGGAGGSGTLAPIQSYKIKTLGSTLFPNNVTVFGDESFDYQEKNGFFSNELNFISSGDGPVQWVAGVYQYFQHYTQPVFTTQPSQATWNGPFGAPAFFCSAPVANGGNGVGTGGVCAPETGFRRFDNRPSVNAESYAGYGQVDWNITDELKVTGGLRYSWDKKYGREQVRLLCNYVPACFAAPEFAGVIPGGLPAVDLTQLGTVVSTGIDPTPVPHTALPKGVTTLTSYDPVTGLASRNYNARWGALTGTLGVEWQPDEDTLVYGKYSRGYKSGGFNIGIFTVLSFNPWTDAEHVDSFEIGAKHQFGDWLTANVAAFHYKYNNLQIPLAVVQSSGGLSQSQTSFFNVPESISQGIEVETNFSPIENLNILFNYSYLDAHITKGFAADPADPGAHAPGAQPALSDAACLTNYTSDTTVFPTGINPATFGSGNETAICSRDIYTAGTAPGPGAPLGGVGGVGWNKPQNLKGNDLPNAPRNKVAVNILYTWNIENFGSLTPSVSYVWRDVQYGALFSRSYNAAPSWDQWDARIGYKSENGNYEVYLWGKNIFDQVGYDAGANGFRLAGTVDNAVGAPTNFVQGVNNPVGYGAVRGEDVTTGTVTTYSPTPPATYGVEFRYKFD